MLANQREKTKNLFYLSLFQPIALKMGLNTSNLSSLWKDKALLEMNVAIMHSFQVGNLYLHDQIL